MRAGMGLLMMMLLDGATTVAPESAAAHHAPGGRFRNEGVSLPPKGLGSLLRWRWDALRQGLPRPAAQATPRVAPDLERLHRASSESLVTWIGHSSVLLQVAGLNLLMDPVFSERVSPVPWAGPRRHHPPGLTLEALPRIDAVLISHNHYDHLDEATVKALAVRFPGLSFLVPLGLGRWFRAKGLTKVRELDWWQGIAVGGLEITLTPAQHWTGRGLGDRMKTLWGGFAVRGAGKVVVYTGDTGYSHQFRSIGERLGPVDLAIVPIGAYAPRWFMGPQHIDPEEAVQVALDLGARRAIGVHWGTFQLSDESLDEPPKVLQSVLAWRKLEADWFRTLALGETISF